MKRMNFGYLGAAIICGGALSGQPVLADGLSGLYLGGNFGRERNEYDTAYVDDLYENAAKSAFETLKFTNTSVNRLDDTWWANAGYMFSPNFGIDAAFIHLGELTYEAAGELVSIANTKQPATITATVTSHGPALSLMLRLPIAESWDLDMRIGDYYAKTDLTTGLLFESKYKTVAQSASASSLLVTAGGAYNFAGHWSIRVDYLRVNQAGNSDTVGKYNVNAATAGVTFAF